MYHSQSRNKPRLSSSSSIYIRRVDLLLSTKYASLIRTFLPLLALIHTGSLERWRNRCSHDSVKKSCLLFIKSTHRSRSSFHQSGSEATHIGLWRGKEWLLTYEMPILRANALGKAGSSSSSSSTSASTATTSSSLSFRPLQETDLLEIKALHEDLFPVRYSLVSLQISLLTGPIYRSCMQPIDWMITYSYTVILWSGRQGLHGGHPRASNYPCCCR